MGEETAEKSWINRERMCSLPQPMHKPSAVSGQVCHWQIAPELKCLHLSLPEALLTHGNLPCLGYVRAPWKNVSNSGDSCNQWERRKGEKLLRFSTYTALNWGIFYSLSQDSPKDSAPMACGGDPLTSPFTITLFLSFFPSLFSFPILSLCFLRSPLNCTTHFLIFVSKFALVDQDDENNSL